MGAPQNSTFQQFTQSLNHGLTLLESSVAIGAAGAPSALAGNGIQAITRLSAGTYQVSFQQAYNRFLALKGFVSAPSSGSTAAGALVPGTVYVIATLGTTTQAQWVTAGLNPAVTAAPGVAFLCAATSGGTGTCSTPASPAVSQVAVVGNAQLTVSQGSGVIVGNYPYVVVETLNAAFAPTDPANGSTLWLSFWLRASSVTGAGG